MMHDGLYVNLFFQRSDVWQNRIMTCKVGSHVAPASLYEIIGRHDAKCDAILWRCPGASGIGLLQPQSQLVICIRWESSMFGSAPSSAQPLIVQISHVPP